MLTLVANLQLLTKVGSSVAFLCETAVLSVLSLFLLIFHSAFLIAFLIKDWAHGDNLISFINKASLVLHASFC